MQTKSTFIFIFSIAACLGVYLFYSHKLMHEGHNWGGDFALYLSQTKAMLNGTTDELVANSKLSCELSYYRMNPDIYPAGYPIMLMPIYAIAGLNFVAFKWLNILCFVLFIVFLLLTISKFTTTIERVLLIALFCTSSVFISFSNNILADVPLMMFVWLTLFYYGKIDKGKVHHYLFLGILCALNVQVKSLSITLFVSILLFESYYALVKNTAVSLWLKKMLVFVSGFLIVVLIFKLSYPSSSSGYFNQASQLTIHSILKNIYYYRSIPYWILHHSNAFVWLSLPVFIVGFVTQLKNQFFYVLFIITHLSLVIIWPFQEGIRFLFFLVPFYFIFSFYGFTYLFNQIVTKFNNYNISYIKYILWVVIVVYSFIQLDVKLETYKELDNEIGSADAVSLIQFVNEQTRTRDKFVFFKPNVLRLLTNRESFYLLNKEEIINSGANWWIYKHGDLPADTFGMQILFNNNSFTVFKLNEPI